MDSGAGIDSHTALSSDNAVADFVDSDEAGEERREFEGSDYPYKKKIKKSAYEKQKAALQVELLKVQRWVKESNEKILILFEGRDAAGKGGTIWKSPLPLSSRSGIFSVMYRICLPVEK